LTGEKARIKSPEGGAVAHDEQISLTTKSNTSKKTPNQGRKGVGYTTGSGSLWNVQEYLASRELRSS
jgi:ubiquitin-protein ligase